MFIVDLTQEMQLGEYTKEIILFFFLFLMFVDYFVHKGNNHIPRREQLVCLAFVVLPCYLITREKFV
jgi:hypothetical protein